MTTPAESANLGISNWTEQIDPYVEAIMEINPDALDIAAKMDEERQRGFTRGPLHGVPVVIKDVRLSTR